MLSNKEEIRSFLEDCTFTIGAKECLEWIAYGHYKRWCQYKQSAPLPIEAFRRGMSANGYKRRYLCACWVFQGIDVNPGQFQPTANSSQPTTTEVPNV